MDIGTQTRILDHGGRSPEKSKPCLSWKERCNMKCYVPSNLLCNILNTIEKKRVKKDKTLGNLGFTQLGMTCRLRRPVKNSYDYNIQGFCGQVTPIPNISVALNL